MKTMARHGFILGIFCAVATGLLAGVNLLTAPAISRQAQAELQASLADVLPEAARFEAAADGDYYNAVDANGAFVGAAFVCVKKGYASDIRTLVGMRSDGTITAIKILSQNETPGLGTRINEVKDDFTLFDLLRGKTRAASSSPWFLEQFRGKNAAGLEGVQTITGATISSRAVIDSVREKAQQIKETIGHGG